MLINSLYVTFENDELDGIFNRSHGENVTAGKSTERQQGIGIAS